MASPLSLAVALVGTVGAAVTAAYVYRDARRVGVSHPVAWAAFAGGALAVGAGLYLFASAPTTGTIMTANTGLVLYGFEREVTRRGDGPTEPTEPGELPGGSPSGGPADDGSGESAG